MPAVINISCYRFAPLTGLKELRTELLESCKGWGLKGTILLAPEGINLFVAGPAEAIDALMERLRRLPGMAELTPKVSLSDHQPFNRMLVRLKKEIISFGVETVRPADYTSPKIAPKELKRWLDEGKPVTLLDTRNDYEVKLGTFKGAIDPEIKTFRGFHEAVRRLPDELKDQPVVMFCTGGIRCEKAGPFMEMEGFRQIYQLDGGILKYFEECGGDHYDGDCFVFDQRVGVDPALKESHHAVCFACQAPLDEEDQRDPRYVEGRSCPYCHKSEPELMASRIAVLQERLAEVSNPLPGSVPEENHRPVNIPAALEKQTLLYALCAMFPQVGADEWRVRLASGRFTNYAGKVRGADHVVHAGERILQWFPPEAEPAVATDIRVRHLDEAIIIVEKPAPLPMHAGGRFHRNTLQHLMNLACEPHVPRAVHRLDANTSGLVVFARTRHFCKLLQRQFVEGTVEKCYLVGVSGQPLTNRFSCDAPVSTEAEVTGARRVDEENGQAAVTHFEVLERREDGTSLLLAVPVTGRTNQIRIHLSHLGHPVLGDPCYQPNGIGNTQTLAPDDPPLRLHAWKLAFRHPLTGAGMRFETDCPWWA